MFFKVCGMRRQEDLDAAARLGFALHGLIFHNKSPRGVTVEQAAALESRGMLRVGVFVRQTDEEMLAVRTAARLDFLQLHGDQDLDCLKRLSAAAGRSRLIRVLWPERYEDLAAFQQAVNQVAPYCGLVLLDAGKSGGGHGKRLSQEFLARVDFPVPWMLAGGMDAEGLSALKDFPEDRLPAGLDFNSKLESAPGVKDAGLMAALLARAVELGFPPMPYEPPLQR